jgi:ABC-2 type transport system ATP-binding protein
VILVEHGSALRGLWGGRGEVFGVLGPNVAGKTTTVEGVAGLRRPDGGSVRVLGPDPARDPEAVSPWR